MKNRKAFTMIELVFVIVVIGILSAIAIPKFVVTRDDAIITKARTTVASVRSALATERQKRILRGDFNTTLGSASSSQVFIMKMGNTETKLLEYGIKECPSSNQRSCWERGSSNGEFKFYGPNGNSCIFSISAGRLNKGACTVSGLTDL
jgi:general secretion pathway protein G